METTDNVNPSWIVPPGGTADTYVDKDGHVQTYIYDYVDEEDEPQEDTCLERAARIVDGPQRHPARARCSLAGEVAPCRCPSASLPARPAGKAHQNESVVVVRGYIRDSASGDRIMAVKMSPADVGS